jgi:hypothetical protein
MAQEGSKWEVSDKLNNNLKRPFFDIIDSKNNRHRSLTRYLQIICRFRRGIDAPRTLYEGFLKLPALIIKERNRV